MGTSTGRHTRLTLFTKYPVPDTAKTRLIPELGAEAAAQLQQRMTEHAALCLRRFGREHPATNLCISYNGGSLHAMRRWLGMNLKFRQQHEGDLGTRISHAMNDAFHQGNQYCVIIGADCPEIHRHHLDAAVANLRPDTVVMGPAVDGGYWLIGMGRQAYEDLEETIFRSSSIPWGTEHVYQLTRERVEQNGYSVYDLPPLSDVDEPEDLHIWKNIAAESPLFSPEAQTISVIIPALNEQDRIRQSVRSAKQGLNTEIVVVDGGSTDRTVQEAEAEHATVLVSAPGRGAQMNHGAAHSTGSILLFLHADSTLPIGFDTHVREALRSERTQAGAFRLDIDSERTSLRFLAWGTNIRSRLLHLPYGDQGLFMTKDLFRQAGGFPDVPILEDFTLIRTLVRRHTPLLLLPVPITTSARRWERHGALKTMLLNQLIIAGYYLGISTSTLARWYRHGALSRVTKSENPQ